MKGPNTLMGICVFKVLTHTSLVLFVWTFCHVFVEMLAQFKCVSFYSDGSGVFCINEGAPSIMHGIGSVNEGGNYID
jgi:hypothetical protein